MACSSCARARAGVVTALARGQVRTAAQIAVKGAQRAIKPLKAPPITQAIRRKPSP